METIIRELKSICLSGYESQAYASPLKSGALTPKLRKSPKYLGQEYTIF